MSGERTRFLSGELLTSLSLIVGGCVIALQIIGINIPFADVILVVMAALVVVGVAIMIWYGKAGESW
ncbi:MAG: hypothetical protein APR53_01125 [Methanoculleus sp. SDB]|nr:MAG: hypothetical protein APR53_01125 [Methanoculleus sp. SDB]